ncbi:MAG: hypothetical protein ABIW82_17235 [Dokdonella sp.]
MDTDCSSFMIEGKRVQFANADQSDCERISEAQALQIAANCKLKIFVRREDQKEERKR